MKKKVEGLPDGIITDFVNHYQLYSSSCCSSFRKRGRPLKKVQRKTVSFFLLPTVVQRLYVAYYQWNTSLAGATRMSRAEFRESVLEKSLQQLEKNRGDD